MCVCCRDALWRGIRTEIQTSVLITDRERGRERGERMMLTMLNISTPQKLGHNVKMDLMLFSIQLHQSICCEKSFLTQKSYMLAKPCYSPEPAILSCCTTRDDLGDEDSRIVSDVWIICPTCYTEPQP